MPKTTKAKRAAPYELEYLTIRIPVHLHDSIREAARLEAERTHRNPERHKSQWVLDALREKLERQAGE